MDWAKRDTVLLMDGTQVTLGVHEPLAVRGQAPSLEDLVARVERVMSEPDAAGATKIIREKGRSTRPKDRNLIHHALRTLRGWAGLRIQMARLATHQLEHLETASTATYEIPSRDRKHPVPTRASGLATVAGPLGGATHETRVCVPLRTNASTSSCKVSLEESYLHAGDPKEDPKNARNATHLETVLRFSTGAGKELAIHIHNPDAVTGKKLDVAKIVHSDRTWGVPQAKRGGRAQPGSSFRQPIVLR